MVKSQKERGFAQKKSEKAPAGLQLSCSQLIAAYCFLIPALRKAQSTQPHKSHRRWQLGPCRSPCTGPSGARAGSGPCRSPCTGPSGACAGRSPCRRQSLHRPFRRRMCRMSHVLAEARAAVLAPALPTPVLAGLGLALSLGLGLRTSRRCCTIQAIFQKRSIPFPLASCCCFAGSSDQTASQ
jgi:hypothetical protein